MAESIIALIFDCDDTLCPDTISFMLQSLNIDPQSFWPEINDLVKKGWDPPLAYMQRILRLVQTEAIMGLTKQRLRELGAQLQLFPGLPDALDELREFVAGNDELMNARVSLEYYVISGGLEEMIRGSRLASKMNGIFGCNFDYDPASQAPVAVKSSVTFTEKTRFVFAVNKGLTQSEARCDPYLVNDAIDDDKRRIPFKHMIYLGDGPSDIPCLSLIKKNGGETIGVSPPANSFRKGYEMARGKRTTVGPYTANYERGSDLRKVLEEIILRTGLSIAIDRRRSQIGAPTHG